MASVPHRHTYYGGSLSGGSTTTTTTQPLNGLSPHSEVLSLGTAAATAATRVPAKEKKRQVTFGPYIVGPTLGEGEFGKVKLGWSNSKPEEGSKNVAIKLVRRDTIPKHSEKEVKIYREINALKHLNHPNIVRLEEVLQNSKYIGIVLQYASGGEFYKYIQKKRRLKEPPACRLFAQLISGVYYMHHKGLAHRDLKLENLLLDEHENLMITDFGFVNEFHKNDLMKTSCGSPCYAAPELVVTARPYEARKADVWSCGVILYAMLAGYLPWDDDPENPEGDDIAKLYHYITKSALKFPEYIKPLPRDLLRRILVSNPDTRLSVMEIKNHEWLRPHAQFLSWTPEDWDAKARAEANNVFRSPVTNPATVLRPHSTCSGASSTNSKGDRRNSIVMDSTLNPQPVPPQESQSHVLTKPSSPSNDLLKRSPVKKHSRSNSAASIALQAVVEAERDFFRSPSTHSLHYDSLSQHNTPPSAGRITSYGITRSATHNHNGGISSSLLNRNSVIVEVSPQKGSVAPVIIPGNNDSVWNHDRHHRNFAVGKSSGISLGRDMPFGEHQFIPQSSRKPRPTSYQPTSTTYSANADFSFNSNHSQLPSTKTKKEPYIPKTSLSDPPMSSNSVSTQNTSPCIALRSPTDKEINTQLATDAPLTSNKITDADRSGYFYNSISGGDGSKEQKYKKQSTGVVEKTFNVIDDGEERTTVDQLLKKQELFSVEPTIVPHSLEPPNLFIPNKESMVTTESPESEVSSKQRSNKNDKKDKRFSLLSFYSFYNNSKSSMESSSDAVESRGVSLDPLKRATTNIIRKLPEKNGKSSESDCYVTPPERGTAALTKKNVKASKTSPDIPNENFTEVVPKRVSMLTPQSKPVSTEENNKTKRNVNRASLVGSVGQQQQQQQQPAARQRYQSTAKKVFDFFKRRSLRL
ncbi:putative serine/threonine protein kinase KIN4 Ecym_8339 [Eremothecium cymbalariae DBVPG|uniref:non-specific serine/threonine protein kinase n=1 Tax=Eremothecium cymbalariae (strain CBS 270.75 / DBVPG 7215 / KCTC 17166 / NRRL Y-17582) TaxID=931890 RepID=G8JXP3_ERECY|nr:Hypothetical protein Ecym_8339 [Eremothecium cymbalariae DBVPG\